MYDDLNHEVRSAIAELQQYLLDQIPPLTASDAVETLMSQPPELLLQQIQAWAVEQGRMQEASQSDFLSRSSPSRRRPWRARGACGS